MPSIKIVVRVTTEMKSTQAETRDSSGMGRKIVSGVVKAMTASALLSWVKQMLENIG